MAVARLPDPIPLADLDLTRMRRRHLRRVMAIESRVYPRPWSGSLFLSEMAQRSTRSYLVARHEGHVVGYAGMMFTGVEAHITNIAVDPDLQGRRVGTRLMYALVTEAVARGVEVLSLEVRVSNRVAQDLYAKFGFTPTGTRKGYYVETNEDALIMVADRVMGTEFRARLQQIRAELVPGADDA